MNQYLIGLIGFFLCLQSGVATENPLKQTYLGSREADPASIVQNVSTIHGDYVENEIDLEVLAPDSLILSRFYSSRDSLQIGTLGGWRFNPHCFLTIEKDPKEKAYTTTDGTFERAYVYIGNSEGAILTYAGWQNTTNLTECSIFKIDPEAVQTALANTARGNISYWTNQKNNEVSYNPQIDSFELHLSNEGKRFYAKHPALGIYTITHETLPSGNKIFYDFDEKGQLTFIKETNASEKKDLAWIKIQYGSEVHIESSDGQTIDYFFQQDPSGALLLTKIDRSHKPNLQYQYQVLDNRALLLRKTLPEGRFVQVDYCSDPANQYKVKSVTTPLDLNESKCLQFSYEDLCTKVDGPGSSKAVYRFDEKSQLIAVEQYLDGALYRVHKKTWGVKKDAGNLLSTSIEDGSGNTFYYKTFAYDELDKGNIIEEREYGNLTGANTSPLHINDDGSCQQKAHIKTYRYFSNENAYGFSQRDIKESGFKCWYKKRTNLLSKRIIFAKGEESRLEAKKRYFYNYNEDAVLTQLIVDDGTSADINNNEGITQRYITTISPKQELPNIGAPEITAESYLDSSGEKEALLRKTANQFDTHGNIVAQAVYDANGKHCYTTEKSYVAGLLATETDPLGNETSYSYDANGNLTRLSQSNTGISFEYIYDLGNRLTYALEKDRMGNSFETKKQYDQAGNKLLEKDRFGNETRYVHDSLGRLVSISYPEVQNSPQSSIRPTYTYAYDLFDHQISVTDPQGNLIANSFNNLGNPTSLGHLDGTKELFKYDEEGSLHRYLGKDGIIQVFEYDFLGRLNHIEYYKRGSEGSNEGFKRKYYNYSSFHLISEEDEREELTEYTYDGAGRLETLSKGGQKTEFIYDSLGRVHGVKKWKSSTDFTLEFKEYDLLNRVVEQRIEDSKSHLLLRTQYIYNDAGYLSQVVGYPQNRKSILTQYEYDSFGRTSKIINGLAGEIKVSYDDACINEMGQKTLKRILTDPVGNQTEEIYDSAGKLTKTSKKDKNGHLLAEVTSLYDSSGNKVHEEATRISSAGLLGCYKTEWSFNQGGQLEALSLGKGTQQSCTSAYKYNSFGDLTANYSRGSQDPITYKYNDYGNVKTISFKIEKEDCLHELFYDKGKNLKRVELASTNQTLTYSYDPNNQLLSETVKDEFGSYQVSCTYDGEGNIQALHLPDKTSIEYRYEGPFVKSVKRLNSAGKELYNYRVSDRDQMGNILEEVLPLQAGARKQTWDQAGWRKEVSTDFFQEKIPEEGFDPCGNVLKIEQTLKDEKSTKEYEYNGLDQLISEKGEIEHSYTYDSLDNRLQKDGIAYTIDGLNQLVEAENTSYTFDSNGNLATKTVHGQTWVYKWNPLNQLISIEDPDLNTVSFTYDISGKRLAKRVEVQNKKTKVFRYFYLGETELGCLDEKGVVIELKIPSDPNDPEVSPSIALEIAKEVYVPLYDLQGNISCLLDPQRRKIVESYRYSAYGEEVISNEKGVIVTNSTLGNPWRYRGKRNEKETKLIWFGKRFYDPVIGRWISPDPLNDIDGPNLYQFVHNNPVNNVDYFGLATEKNENQSKEFTNYFYGEYEPHCHCEAHRTCKRGGDIGSVLSNFGHGTTDFLLNNARFHGSMQAFVGLSEAGIGCGMTLASGGLSAPLGLPVMAHGFDHFFTGLQTAFTGSPRDSVTSQLLQKTGMTRQYANGLDSTFSIIGPMKGAAVMLGQTGASVLFTPSKAGIIVSNERTLLNFSGAAGKHMYEVERRIPVQILDTIIKSPMARIKDPRGVTNSMMYYSRISRNGKLYNVEVLYDKYTNTVMHFKYGPESMGPLKGIK